MSFFFLSSFTKVCIFSLNEFKHKEVKDKPLGAFKFILLLLTDERTKANKTMAFFIKEKYKNLFGCYHVLWNILQDDFSRFYWSRIEKETLIFQMICLPFYSLSASSTAGSVERKTTRSYNRIQVSIKCIVTTQWYQFMVWRDEDLEVLFFSWSWKW